MPSLFYLLVFIKEIETNNGVQASLLQVSDNRKDTGIFRIFKENNCKALRRVLEFMQNVRNYIYLLEQAHWLR